MKKQFKVDGKFVICPVCKEKIPWDRRFKHGCLFKHLYAVGQTATYLDCTYNGKKYVGPSTGG